MKNESTIPQLSKNTKKFIQLQVLFGGMSAILALFINTFLLNAYGSFSKEVLMYNVIMSVVQPFTMITAMKLSEQKSALFTQRIGFVFYAVALVVLCLFGDLVAPLYSAFAVLLSFGAGYYYAVYSAQMLCYTSDENRDLIAGILGLLGSIISAFLPLLSGMLISSFGAHIGYQVVFGIAAVLAIITLLTSRKLEAIPKHKKEPVLGNVYI